MTILDLHTDWGVDDTECPKCNKRLSSRAGMEQHYRKVHDTVLAFAVVQCDVCKKVERRDRTPVKKSDTHVCSVECESEWKSSTHVPEDHNFWKGGKNEYECNYCGNTVMKHPSVAAQVENHYCDRECHSSWQSECRPSEEHNWWKGGPAQVECAVCGENLERKQSMAELRDRHFCSKQCEGEWKSENMIGPNHPNWKGYAKSYYGKNWRKQREKRLEYDDYECVICGVSHEEHKVRHGRGLEVHHIDPIENYRSGRELDWEAANRLENLLTVCRACHARWEGIPLQPEVIE